MSHPTSGRHVMASSPATFPLVLSNPALARRLQFYEGKKSPASVDLHSSCSPALDPLCMAATSDDWT